MGVIEKQRITALQTLLREAGIDYYIVPTADYHNSEYVSDYFKMREFCRDLPDRQERWW